MARNQTLPHLWLLSDARNDAVLDTALARLPRGSGFVFRHYHLAAAARERRFRRLATTARACGHVAILSGAAPVAVDWGADGIYGPAARLTDGGVATDDLLKLATAHDRGEIAAATRTKADGIFLSPVFATRSHADARPLGPARFRALAARTAIPVIALGGMTPDTARQLGWPRWGAIDGLSAQQDS